MKKGISTWAFSEATYAERFELAKKHGFEGVELALDAEGELALTSDKDALAKIKKSAADNGIELYSIATGLYWANSLASDDADMRKRAFDTATKQLECAAELGCDTILVVPGATGVDFAPELGVTDYADAYDRAVEAMKKLSVSAEKLGVSIGVENVWNKFLTSPTDMAAFIDKVDSDFVGSYFDVGNVLVNGYPEHWIKILGKRIKKVHFKDFKRSVGTLEGFCDLLAGDVDYSAVMAALKNAGYDGWVTAEVFPYKAHNEVMLAHTSHAMDIILGR